MHELFHNKRTMTRCIFAEMLYFFTIEMVMVSCVVLWNDAMDNITTFTPTQQNTALCPDAVNGPCWYISYNNYIYHDVISTILYENITLTFDIHPHCQSVINGTGQSTFSHATDGSTNTWSTLAMVTNGGRTPSHTETLPVITENNIAASIRIQAAESGNDCCCFLSNAKLEATAVVPSDDFVISNSFTETTHSAAMSDCHSTYGTHLAMVTSFELNKKATAICNAFCVGKAPTPSTTKSSSSAPTNDPSSAPTPPSTASSNVPSHETSEVLSNSDPDSTPIASTVSGQDLSDSDREKSIIESVDDMMLLLETQIIPFAFFILFCSIYIMAFMFYSLSKQNNTKQIISFTLFSLLLTRTSADTLFTTLGDRISYVGNMFDLCAKTNLQITSLDIHCFSDGSYPFEIYIATAINEPYSPIRSDSSSWTLIHQQTASCQPVGTLTVLNTFNINTIPALINNGDCRGFYVTHTWRNVLHGLYVTNGVSAGSIFDSNADLDFKEGIALAYPFGGNSGPYVWNGRIHYNAVTDAPTLQTSAPTLRPTNNPTDIPTNNPTDIPTIDPTHQPTNIPTKNPVTDAPTTQLTADDGNEAEVVTVTVTGTDSSNVDEVKDFDVNNNVHSKYALAFPYIVTAISCLVLLTAIFGYIDSKYFHINDFFKVFAVLAALLQALDLISDIFLALHISLFIETEQFFFILFILAIACIVIPILVSMLQLMHQIRKHWGRDDNIKLWLTNNSTMLYFLSISTGSSFSAVQLMNSNLFCLNNFSMGLTNAQFRRYQTKKIYSIILLENFPQLILQSLFLIKISQFDAIAVCSMIFSIISIIVTISSMLTAKQMLDSSGFAIIEFEVTGPAIVQKSHVCKNQVSKIRRQISSVLGLNQSRLIEVMQPSTIPRGLKLKLYIHLNHIQSRQINYKMLLNESQQSGELAQIIQHSWELNAAPVCSQIVFTVEESKNRKKNTVSIKIDSDSENIGSDAKVGVDFFDSIELPPIPKVRPLHLIPTRGGGECEEDKNELIDEVEGGDEGLKDVPIVNDFDVIETLSQTAGGII